MNETLTACMRKSSQLSDLANQTFRAAERQHDKKLTAAIEELATCVEFLCQQTNDVVLDVSNEGLTREFEARIAETMRVMTERERQLRGLKSTLDKMA